MPQQKLFYLLQNHEAKLNSSKGTSINKLLNKIWPRADPSEDAEDSFFKYATRIIYFYVLFSCLRKKQKNITLSVEKPYACIFVISESCAIESDALNRSISTESAFFFLA